jgi:hypothetical protein
MGLCGKRDFKPECISHHNAKARSETLSGLTLGRRKSPRINGSFISDYSAKKQLLSFLDNAAIVLNLDAKQPEAWRQVLPAPQPAL